MRGYYESKVTDIIVGKNKMNRQKRTELEVARGIAKSLGIYTAARYLCLRSWSLDAARFQLLGV